ncbi:Protein of unknown function [Alteribacillus persepolensis]|uniref:DUF2536 domain-containing protein n=1 Tax=Alteribacillus persepolensis TaxID=568899 RepID=A0A1G8DLC6_9BACI|nr:DUF2536 family protein [Alteribacillus persepolensis]SDH58371.1 Protein of unknown function [Alteribacillus persepolensis]
MGIQLQPLGDKIEFFQSASLQELESKINKQVEHNQDILLSVHHVQHHVHYDPSTSQPVYTAVVHFKSKQK